MNDVNSVVDRAMQAQIDRLVSGELSDSERRSVLAWLDEDVRRWRPCAIAFLEAQTWEAAASSLSACGVTTAERSASEGKPAPVRRAIAQAHRSGLQALATIAAVAIAFLSGILTAPLIIRSGSSEVPPIVGLANTG